MADEMLVQTNALSSPRTVSPMTTGLAELSGGDWADAPPSAPVTVLSGLEPFLVYLHAFRRHWLLSVGLGLVLATAAGLAVYYGIGTTYTATSALSIDMQVQSVLGGPISTMDRDRFEIFKNTQAQSMTSRFVLLAALRKTEVARIPDVKEEPDPASWLAGLLSVGFPGRGEIMTVSVTRQDPHEAAVLVNAVVDSYYTDVVKAETDQRRARLNKLETACSDKEQQIRDIRRELRNLATQYGTTEAETITQQQQNVINELSLYRGELARREFETGELSVQLAAQKALLDNLDNNEVPADEVDFMMNTDPIARELSIELARKKQEQTYNDVAVSPKSKTGNKFAERYSRELQMLQEQYDQKVKEIKEKVRQRKRSLIMADIVKLETSFDVKKKQYEALTKKYDDLKEKASKFGGTTVDIEMQRADLKRSEVILAELNAEREKLKVELQNAPRITVREPAEDPVTPSGGLKRKALTLFAMLIAFCFPAVALTLWDTQSRRINTAEDVSKGLRLPVIGSVPLIPSRVIRRLGSPSKRNRSWHLRLTESVDGITARILHKAELGQERVIMVSSAGGGEGKTTLATQLALSLARTKRKVVLVDFDLRRPSFDSVFGISLEPGVCELLRSQNDVADLARPSGTENLDVVTAGRWDRQALASLSNGRAGALFQQLREQYDFVVIDTSPLLPVADARFVSRHVDTVVLSVLRDVSQAPKIQAACDILAAFGVPSVEAVVTGPASSLYGRQDTYESTISA